MVGDFMVCVDRLISSACFDSANGAGAGGGGGGGVVGAGGFSEGGGEQGSSEEKKGGNSKYLMMVKKKKGGEAVECRICQEEGEEREMEAPCACNGTLKFAHRKCIQRWCNKKGNITCEICNQVYAPNYSVPPTRANSDVIAIDIRQSWGARIDLHDSHFLAIAAEQELLHAEYEDYAAAHTSGIACCRSVALILMLLLFIRHVVMFVRDAGMVQDASAFFNVGLQFAGFILPCYVIVRSCYILQSRRRRHA